MVGRRSGSFRWAITGLALSLSFGTRQTHSAIVVKPNVAESAPIDDNANPQQFDLQLRPGLPLDFPLFAHARYPRAADQAVAETRYRESLGIDESGAPLADPAAAETEESFAVRDPVKRPALYASEVDIHPGESVPQPWIETLAKRRSEIARVLRSVGRIEVENLTRDRSSGDLPAHAISYAAGTGFVAAPGIAMTNRHVARIFVDPSSLEFRRVVDGRSAMAWINFAATLDSDSPRRFRLARCLYVAPEDAPDVALFQIANEAGSPPPPLPISFATFAESELASLRKSVVCGYPVGDGSEVSGVGQLMRVWGVKRVAPGELWARLERGRIVFVHDCSTSNGNSGSPVLDLESGMVVAIHRSGAGRVNYADPMWEAARLEGFRDLLPIQNVSPDPSPEVAPNLPPRPSLATCDGVVDLAGSPDDWRAPFEANATERAAAIRGVGLLEINERGAFRPAGTAFVAAPGVIMTVGPSTGGRTLGWSSDPDATYTVDFGRDRCSQAATDRRPVRPIYIGQGIPELELSGGPVILFQVEGETPPPLKLQTARRDDLTGASVFTVGYPFEDARASQAEQLVVFGSVFGTKAVAPGAVIEAKDIKLRYDCSTTGGYGGAPLIDFASNAVVGVHVGGIAGQSNYAVPLWRVWDDPEMQRHLANSVRE